jgi:predicted membrane protein
MILIGLGLINLFSKQHKFPGLFFIAIGVFFMLPYITDVPLDFKRMFWPALLILTGFAVIIRGRNKNFTGHHHETSVDDNDLMDEMAVFGGGDKVITSQNFKGGKLTCVFGGTNLYLNRAILAEGKNVLDIFAMFGGSKIVVPEDWSVKIDVASVFGGFNDKRIKNTSAKVDESRHLIIKGFVIFGGGEIRNY